MPTLLALLIVMEEHNSKSSRLSLASSSKTNPEVLAQIAASEKEDEDICFAIAQNINTPIDTLKYLCGWRANEMEKQFQQVSIACGQCSPYWLSIAKILDLKKFSYQPCLGYLS